MSASRARLLSSLSARSRYERLCASLYTRKFSAQNRSHAPGTAVDVLIGFRRHPSHALEIFARKLGASQRSSFSYSNISSAARVYRSARSCLSRSSLAELSRVRNASGSSASKMRFNRFARFVTPGETRHSIAYVSDDSSYPVTQHGSQVNCPWPVKYLDTAPHRSPPGVRVASHCSGVLSSSSGSSKSSSGVLSGARVGISAVDGRTKCRASYSAVGTQSNAAPGAGASPGALSNPRTRVINLSGMARV